jgi:hypothetical protein
MWGQIPDLTDVGLVPRTDRQELGITEENKGN